MVLFGLALGIFELIFFGVFFLLLAFGTAFDRKGNSQPKWYIFGVGLIAIVAWFWNDWTVDGVWGAVKSAEFWVPVGAYLGAGLAYSLLEFFLDIRRSARYFRKSWESHLKNPVDVPELNADGSQKTREVPQTRTDGTPAGSKIEKIVNRKTIRDLHISAAAGDKQQLSLSNELTMSFIRSTCDSSKIIQPDMNSLGELEPRVHRGNLTDHIAAWTMFWPFYAISLVLGDLLTEIFRVLADVLANISTRLVKVTFADVFKV